MPIWRELHGGEISPGRIRIFIDVLGVVVLASLIFLPHDMQLPGVVYLMAASLAAICSVGTLMILKSREKVAPHEERTRTLPARARILFWVAWQLTILGALTISGGWPQSLIHGIADCALTILFSACTYSLVRMSDLVEQAGGYRPLPYFGLERSRRFTFVCFGLAVLLSVMLLTLAFAAHSGGYSPEASLSSNLSLLTAAVLSVMEAGLVFQRYRNSPPTDRRVSWTTAAVCVYTLGFAIYRSSAYVYALLFISTVGMAISVLFLWRHIRVTDNKAGSPEIAADSAQLVLPLTASSEPQTPRSAESQS